MRKKIVFLPYDMDTGIGINNEGALVFSYNLEDIDKTESGADVFNGQQSVLWKNMRAAFFNEMKAMYQNLRSTGVLSYQKVEKMFEDHQAVWPEAVFNEDAWFKYLAPLVEKGNASYLSMLQGSKAEQRKWWLYNRFRYIDSKYNAGDSLSDVITLRGYAKADITIQPYADVYCSVKYGSYLVQERGARNVQTTLECPLDNVNDTEIYIYSASQLADVGDLSGLMVGYADFSHAINLQSLKIGDSTEGYENNNLTELYLGNNDLLRTLDVRNCPSLAQAVDISGCSNIEHVYFDGTSITGLDLPQGGILKTLRLPGTIANLTVIGHTGITTFVLPDTSHLTTLRVENTSSVIDTKSFFDAMTAGCRVRLIGFNWTVASDALLKTLRQKIDTMRGLNEAGGNEDKAQLLGTITCTTVSGENLKGFHENYPDVTINYTNLNSKCYFMNYNGTSVIYTATTTNGSNAVFKGTTPTKPSTISQVFTFAGWSRTLGGELDSTALLKVYEDRYVYPVFTESVRTYTVRYYVGSTVIQTKSNVPYGTSVYYTGNTPTNTADSDPSDWQVTGWDKLAENIQGDVNCYAQFKYIGSAYKHLMDGKLAGEYTNTTATIVANYAMSYMASLTKVEFTEATEVGYMGFANSTNLKTVILPKVTKIGGSSFASLSKITTFTAPLLKEVVSSAMQHCSALTALNFPELETVGASAFQYCSGVKTINMPKLKTVGNYGFQYMYGLTKLTLPEGLTKLGEKALRGCSNLTYLCLPSTLVTADSSCFCDCSKLKKVVFLGKPTGYLSNYAFKNDTAITDIYVNWNEGEVRYAPWEATNATIHYKDEGWMDDLESILE